FLLNSVRKQKHSAAVCFNILFFACFAFILLSNSVLAAENAESYQAIEAALNENRNKFSVTLNTVEERIATLKKIDALNEAQQSELSSLIQAQDWLLKSIE